MNRRRAGKNFTCPRYLLFLRKNQHS